MKRFHRGEVVLVDYPFSDSKHQSKLRPAIVIREDTPGKYILCKITHIDRRTRNKGQWVIKTSEEGIQMGLETDSFIHFDEFKIVSGI